MPDSLPNNPGGPKPWGASLADAAARLGLPVFPCGHNKRPITAHGFYDALTGADAIQLFQQPGAVMIGVPTGAPSGLIGIDVDIKKGARGREWLDAHRSMLPQTRTHRTESGGLHLLFEAPAGVEIRNSASRIAPGIDVRGEGGYVIYPPSPGYAVADETPPAVMPAWLVLACLKPDPAPKPAPTPATPSTPYTGDGTPYGRAALERECSAIRYASDGQKHHALNKAAYSIGGLVAAGELPEGAALSELRAALNDIRARCDDFAHAEKTLRTAFAQGMAAPRAVPERPAVPMARAPFGIPDGEALPADVDPETGEVMPDKPDTRPDTHLKPGGKPPLPLIYFADAKANLDAADFIEGLLIEEAMSVIYGPSNCGKTFFATDLAMHVATGRPWRGKEIEPGGVIYCALEGSHGISNRVAAFKQANGLEGCEVPFAIIPVALNLLDPNADADRVIEAVAIASATMGVPVKWVIMDTLSRALAGGNENSPEDMGALVSNGNRIQQAAKAHLSWIHHSGKDQAAGARGHSLLRAATDTEIELSRPDSASPSIATVTKQRELPIEGRFVFKLNTVELGTNRRGKPVTSCVVEAVEEGPATQPRARLSAGQREALSALHEALIEAGRTATGHDIPEGVRVVPINTWRAAFYARSVLDNQEAKQKAFVRGSKALQQDGLIGARNNVVWIVGDDE